MIKIDNEKILEIVNQKFTDFLAENNYRKTQERYAILNLIYSDPRRFDMNLLFTAMNEQNFRVSRATLYNTMQLLLECNLVIKNRFEQNNTYYERAYNNEIHHYLICTNCHIVREYRNAELKFIIQNRKIKNFNSTHYNLQIFGICNNCARRFKLKDKQTKLKK